ncbi:hypothetical protein ABHI18_007351 [Aspergillus niger]
MRPNYHDIMQSGTVGFIIGKSRKRFWIHNALTSHFPKKILNYPVNDEIYEVDFGRCCEFVYTGDYSIPLPTRESHHIEQGKPAWTPLKRWNPTQLSENISHSTSIDDYIAHLIEQLGCSTWDKNERDGLTGPVNDYTELTRLLANFTISEDRTGDIVSLLRFVFVESEQMKDIQKLLCDYAAWNVEVLMHDSEFEKLLDAAPSLEKVIFRLMWM